MTPDPLLPALEEELVRTARRSSLPRARRRRLLVVLVGATLGVTATATAAVSIFGDPVGSSPDRYGPEPPEPNLRYAKAPVVLARVDQGRDRFQIVGYRFDPRGGASRGDLCLDVVLLPSREGFGCLQDTGYVQGTGSGSLTGAAEPDVRQITVSYRIGARKRGLSTATVARATDARSLTQLGLEPFSIWKARLPRGAFAMQVTAIDDNGKVLWRAVDPSELASCTRKKSETTRCKAVRRLQ